MTYLATQDWHRPIPAIMRVLCLGLEKGPYSINFPFCSAPIVTCYGILEANEYPGLRWSMASLLFLLSWAVLQGPITYGKHSTFESS